MNKGSKRPKRRYETEENKHFKLVFDTIIKNHKITFASLETDYSWVKDARNFRLKFPPPRDYLIEFSNKNKLKLFERNQLLLAGGYRPELIYPENEQETERLIELGRTIVDNLSMPAYLITHKYEIPHWNKLTPYIFGMTEDQLNSTPNNMRNIFTFLFDAVHLPLREILERDQKGWKYTAELNVFWFKLDNILSQYDEWYKDLEQRLISLDLPDFKQIWSSIQIETAREQYYDYVTNIPITANSSIKIRGLRIRYSEYEFPRIVAYVPGDDMSREFFNMLS
jgi:hypothetical protein